MSQSSRTLSTITNTSHKRPGPASKTLPKVIKIDDESEDKKLALQIVKEDENLRTVNNHYRVMLWLNATDKDKLSLRVSTLSGRKHIVCITYKQLYSNVYTYQYDNDSKFRFILLSDLIISENSKSVSSACDAAEAYSYLLSRVIKFQHLKFPLLRLPLSGKNTDASAHAKHWKNEEKLVELLIKFKNTDLLDIKLSSDLHPMFQNLGCKQIKFYNIKFTYESLQKLNSDESIINSPAQSNRGLLSGIGKFNCRICGETIKTSAVTHHFNNHHKLVPKLKCVKCDKATHIVEELENHMNMHQEGVECPICHRPFQTKDSLIQHNKSHVQK